MHTKNKLVQGVGINDCGDSVKINGQHIQSYRCWVHMIQRCYNQKRLSKYPTYVECTVASEWLYFSNFKKWHDANYREGFDLDKDILFEGNKVYSANTCRFVPHYINLLLTTRRVINNLPIGISKHGNNYAAFCSDGNCGRLSKCSSDIQYLVNWYSETKTKVVREVATRALLTGDIQQDVFDALVARKF
jgi:hypothetical protein